MYIDRASQLGSDGLYQTLIAHVHCWARGERASGSRRLLARHVGTGGLAVLRGGAAPRSAKEGMQQDDLRSGHPYNVYDDAQGWWDREGGAWRGRRGSAWPETARNSRFGRSEVVGGRSGRVRRGLPRRHEAGDQVGGPWGCGRAGGG